MDLIKLDKEKTVAFSGYRPHKFDFPLTSSEKYERLVNRILEEIVQAIEVGYTNAIIGGAPGFDILSAELVGIAKRVAPGGITLICALPYSDFSNSSHFNEDWRLRYNLMIKNCDHIINITGKENEIYGCYQSNILTI